MNERLSLILDTAAEELIVNREPATMGRFLRHKANDESNETLELAVERKLLEAVGPEEFRITLRGLAESNFRHRIIGAVDAILARCRGIAESNPKATEVMRSQFVEALAPEVLDQLEPILFAMRITQVLPPSGQTSFVSPVNGHFWEQAYQAKDFDDYLKRAFPIKKATQQPPTQFIGPTGISSEAAVGRPTISQAPPITIFPGGVPSEERGGATKGDLNVSLGGASLSAVGVSASPVSKVYATHGIVRSDSPTSQDQLGRKEYAKHIADHFREVRKATKGKVEQSLVAHLHGPWGSGKSSLIKFLRREFESGDGWNTLEFNAWQHQHVEPPWFPLHEAIHGKFSWPVRVREFFWRRGVSIPMVLITIGVVLLAALSHCIFAAFGNQIGGILSWILGTAVATFVVSHFGTFDKIRKLALSLLPSASSGEQLFAGLGRDPLDELRTRFARKATSGKSPIVVFIDDLDRCQPLYVVRLLEAIQTLFSTSAVFYVISAEKNWVTACFDREYEKLGVPAPLGKDTIGALFLEKIFQVSLPIPEIPISIKQRFLSDLLGTRREANTPEVERSLEVEIKKNVAILSEIGAPEKRRAFVESGSEEERLAKAIAYVSVSASDTDRKAIEHRLEKFEPLIESNPRAMKLLVTNYGILESYVRLSSGGEDVDGDQIALWLIATNRFPWFVQLLRSDPGNLPKLRAACESNENNDDLGQGSKLKNLLRDEGIKLLLCGDASQDLPALDEKFLRKMSRWGNC